MAKIRTVKPELFRHDDLFEAEKHYQLPLRLAFTGLFGCCDREGRFRWTPRSLKLDILPYDELDFADVLNALWQTGFIKKYQWQDKYYGYIPSWHLHQSINKNEPPSKLPDPQKCVHEANPLGGGNVLSAATHTSNHTATISNAHKVIPNLHRSAYAPYDSNKYRTASNNLKLNTAFNQLAPTSPSVLQKDQAMDNADLSKRQPIPNKDVPPSKLPDPQQCVPEGCNTLGSNELSSVTPPSHHFTPISNKHKVIPDLHMHAYASKVLFCAPYAVNKYDTTSNNFNCDTRLNQSSLTTPLLCEKNQARVDAGLPKPTQSASSTDLRHPLSADKKSICPLPERTQPLSEPDMGEQISTMTMQPPEMHMHARALHEAARAAHVHASLEVEMEMEVEVEVEM